MNLSKYKDIINKINEAVVNAIPKEPKEVYGMLPGFISNGGKRIRPLIALLTQKAFDIKNEEIFDIAVTIELFHNFTLIHDDIEDGSELRRGKPTLHIAYNMPVALNAGDTLYTLVWKRLLNKNKDVVEMLAKSFLRVVEGQAYELYFEYEERFDLNEEDYFKIVKGKTSSLLAASIAFPVLYKNKELAERLYNIGIKMGYAFQIQDDLLNLFGEEEKYKKKIGDDITEGKRTLLVIYALNHLGKEKKRLEEILRMHSKDPSIIKEAISLIEKSGAREYCTKVAKGYANEVVKELNALLPDNEYKEDLLFISRLLVDREV